MSHPGFMASGWLAAAEYSHTDQEAVR